jgi:hypothetical protein
LKDKSLGELALSEIKPEGYYLTINDKPLGPGVLTGDGRWGSDWIPL